MAASPAPFPIEQTTIAEVGLSPGSYQLAFSTPTLGLSGTICRGTPPMKLGAGHARQSSLVGSALPSPRHRCNWRHPPLRRISGPTAPPGRPVNHVDRLSGIVDEQPLAGWMNLPHCRRQPAFPIAIELPKTGITVSLRILRAVFLP